ncbi:MAG: hypothetical protein EZS28_043145, partial [Streblomastix strix]
MVSIQSRQSHKSKLSQISKFSLLQSKKKQLQEQQLLQQKKRLGITKGNEDEDKIIQKTPSEKADELIGQLKEIESTSFKKQIKERKKKEKEEKKKKMKELEQQGKFVGNKDDEYEYEYYYEDDDNQNDFMSMNLDMLLGDKKVLKKKKKKKKNLNKTKKSGSSQNTALPHQMFQFKDLPSTTLLPISSQRTSRTDEANEAVVHSIISERLTDRKHLKEQRKKRGQGRFGDFNKMGGRDVIGQDSDSDSDSGSSSSSSSSSSDPDPDNKNKGSLSDRRRKIEMMTIFNNPLHKLKDAIDIKHLIPCESQLSRINR